MHELRSSAVRPLRAPLLALVVLASGCSSGEGSSTDPPLDAATEIDPSDTTPADTGGTNDVESDTGTEDTPADTGAIDTGTADTGTVDTGTIDTGTIDSGGVDATIDAADAKPSDASPPDTATGDAGAVDAGGDAGTPLTRARVFISGHSLTDNPLADHLASIAASLSSDHNWNQQIGIGSPIRVRTKGMDTSVTGWPGYSTGKNRSGSNMNVIEELKSPKTLGAGERYDHLVITERHDILSTIQWENTVGYLRHYHDRLTDGNAAGNTYLYHSWLGLSKTNPTPWIDHEKKALYAWECVASKVNQTLTLNKKPGRVMTLPAGAALVALVERLVAGTVPGITGTQLQRMNAIFSDDVHLTNLGSYYVALVTYASVYRRSPIGAAGPTGASASTVAALQQIAWDYVKAYYAKPAFDTHTMTECRSYISTNVCPSFWTLLGNTSNIKPCQDFFGSATASGNPFRDETSYTPLPAP